MKLETRGLFKMKWNERRLKALHIRPMGGTQTHCSVYYDIQIWNHVCGNSFPTIPDIPKITKWANKNCQKQFLWMKLAWIYSFLCGNDEQ